MNINELKKIFKDNDWEVHDDVLTDGTNSWELEKYSPAGEDFLVTIEFKTIDEAIEEFKEYVEEFNTEDGKEEHIKTIMNANDAPSLRELVQDADDIADMLNDTLNALLNNNKLEEADNNDEDTKTNEDNNIEEDEALEELLDEFKSRSPLYERVVNEIIEDSEGYEGNKREQIQARLDDIGHGLVTGVVGSLIYYSDTIKFFDTYYDDIWDLFEEIFGEDGDTLFHHLNDTYKISSLEIIMNSDRVKNDLAWMSYEIIAGNLSDAIYELDHSNGEE